MSKVVITQEKIKEINELYIKLKTYSGVARVVGCAPATVKKYIIPNYIPQEQVKIIKFDKSKLKDVSFEIFKNKKNWGELCVLSEEEEEEMKELRKEVAM